MPVTLYAMKGHGSAPARAAWMTCKAAGVDVTVKTVDLFSGEQNQDWFLKMNPAHTVPVLDDDGLYISESRAIMRYVAAKYASDSPLYPRDLRQRARVDMALDHDLGTTYKIIFYEYCRPQIFTHATPPDPTNLRKELEYLDTKTPLAEGKYITGDVMTIADISAVASVCFLEVTDFSIEDFPNVAAWVDKMKAKPFFPECNSEFDVFKVKARSGGFRK